MNQPTREMRTRKKEQKRLDQIARRAKSNYYDMGPNFTAGEFTDIYRASTTARRNSLRYAIETRRLGEALPADNQRWQGNWTRHSTQRERNDK